MNMQQHKTSRLKTVSLNRFLNGNFYSGKSQQGINCSGRRVHTFLPLPGQTPWPHRITVLLNQHLSHSPFHKLTLPLTDCHKIMTETKYFFRTIIMKTMSWSSPRLTSPHSTHLTICKQQSRHRVVKSQVMTSGKLEDGYQHFREIG